MLRTIYLYRHLSPIRRFSGVAESVNENLIASGLVRRMIRSAQLVCFDVDSTVITEEGIDKLAEFKGVGQQVSDLTKRAMGGQVLFQDALSARLDIIKPSKSDIESFISKHPFQLTEGIEDTIEALHLKGVVVYLVSGGFRQMIEPVALKLGIPSHRIFANTLEFNADESYKSFDATEPTSRDGGKAAVVQRLKDFHGYDPIIMIGDGATDMQARPPANVFIGYGGVVEREAVKNGADWYVKDFKELINIINSEA